MYIWKAIWEDDMGKYGKHLKQEYLPPAKRAEIFNNKWKSWMDKYKL